MLKVGLIGAGFLGKIHLSLLTQMNNIEFTGFYDIDPDNTAELQLKYHTPVFSNSLDLIKASDALVIATPTTTHFEYAKQCIELGKSIFIEKPVGASIEETNQLQLLAKNYSHVIQIGMVERFNPAYQAALPHLANIKSVYCNRLAPFTPRGADVSVVMDVMIHDIDIVLSMVNSEVKHIAAFGEKIISNTVDLATAHVEFENGFIAKFTASRMAERKYRLTEFVGPNEIYKVDFLNKKAFEYEGVDINNNSMLKSYLKGQAKDLKVKELPVVEINAIGEELKSFVDSIIHNKKVVVSLDDGIRAMKLAKEIEDQMNLDN